LTAIHAATASKKSRLSILPDYSGHAQAVLYDSTGEKPSSFRAEFLD
jgi:hypothetical protein